MNHHQSSPKKLTWINFLHIYQPPTQKQETFAAIVDQSYRKLIRILQENPRAKITLNMNATLTEQLAERGFNDVLAGFRALGEKGQIEFTGGAKYHAFLPLLPESEIRRQITLNEEANRRLLGDKAYHPTGFHTTELAYQKRVLQIIQSMGFHWTLLNETAYKGKLFSEIDFSKIFRIPGIENFTVFFRDRRMSDIILRGKIYELATFKKLAEKEVKPTEYLITAMDGETFGHHRPDLDKLLEAIYKDPDIEAMHLSDLLKQFREVQKVEPVESTWASMESELDEGIPYAQWKYPSNLIHALQWELTYFAIATVEGAKADPGYPRARDYLDRGLHSDHYWWAGANPWWSIEHIEAGAHLLVSSLKALENVPKDIHDRADDYYRRILFTAFDWQRSGYAHKLSNDYTDRITQELYGEFEVLNDLT